MSSRQRRLLAIVVVASLVLPSSQTEWKWEKGVATGPEGQQETLLPSPRDLLATQENDRKVSPADSVAKEPSLAESYESHAVEVPPATGSPRFLGHLKTKLCKIGLGINKKRQFIACRKNLKHRVTRDTKTEESNEPTNANHASNRRGLEASPRILGTIGEFFRKVPIGLTLQFSHRPDPYLDHPHPPHSHIPPHSHSHSHPSHSPLLPPGHPIFSLGESHDHFSSSFNSLLPTGGLPLPLTLQSLLSPTPPISPLLSLGLPTKHPLLLNRLGLLGPINTPPMRLPPLYHPPHHHSNRPFPPDRPLYPLDLPHGSSPTLQITGTSSPPYTASGSPDPRRHPSRRPSRLSSSSPSSSSSLTSRPLKVVDQRDGVPFLTELNGSSGGPSGRWHAGTSFRYHPACIYAECRVLYYECLGGRRKARVMEGEKERHLNVGDPFSCGLYEVCCAFEDSVTASSEVDNTLSGSERCGLKNDAVSGRISNQYPGDGEAEFGEYPWQAAVLKKEGVDNIYVCAGTLISDILVLTAAHCITGYRPIEMRIRLGEWDVNTDTEFYPNVEYDVAAIYVHPQFLSSNLMNDIALIVMVSRVDSLKNPHIAPICLPDSRADFTGQRCSVTGWGKDGFGDNGRYQNVLKEVDLPVIPQQVCQSQLRQTRLGPGYRLHPGMMCAGGEAGKDACKGDGGGPLACEGRGGKYELAGIVSWGIGCGQRDVPGVYVNVASYVHWIHSISN
ncbi:uncharacterized protein LOC143029601 isoform X2 [Oratosquilla oratoria]